MTQVEVTFGTGHKEIDEEGLGGGVFDFDTEAEAKAFERGISEAMSAAEGWLDAWAEVKRLDA